MLLRLISAVTFLLGSVVTLAASQSWSSGPGYQFGKTTYTVSSILPSKNGPNYYGPQHLFAGDPAWCVDTKRDHQPWVKITLDRPSKFQQLYIINGYAKNKKSFADNQRAKKIKITAPHGFQQIVTLKDTMTEQTVKLKLSITVGWVKVQVLSTYPGKKFSDLCFSGMVVNLEQFNYQ